MLMAGFRGTALSSEADILEDISTRNLGGVVLFEKDVPTASAVRNIESPNQLQALVTQLRTAARTPLLIAIDQEGGYVRRLRAPFGLGGRSSARHFGNLDKPEVTHRRALRTARTLARLGINFNFAPVVDLDVNPDSPAIGHYERSYGGDTPLVVRHAREVIRAHRQVGVLTAIKHFPGHGSARGDSHDGVADISKTWSRAELEPFAQLIRDGAVDAVMTAHVFNSQLDPALPTTLSRASVHGVLREQLGWDGVVVSDDLQMGAIRERYGLERTIELAIRAGVDILVFANNSIYDPQIVARAVGVIRGLVESGRLSEADIDRAYQRIQRLKQKLDT
jgi:beta-N-acetylhexosaminidase